MKKIVRNSLLVVLFTTILFACSDFIVKDLKNKDVTLLAPANNLVTIQLTHTFWWDFVEGAEGYNLQIVEGSFTSVTNYVLDTLINKNKFVYTLYPGTFHWRVKGVNNGGETNFATFKLEIDSSLDISSQQVILTAPSDLNITNNDNSTFTWNSLLNADDYLIEIHQNTWGGGLVYGPQIVNGTSITTVLPEGTIVWGVQARNATSNTATSFSIRTLTIDTTPPNMVTLVAPADNATLSNTFNTYSWNQGANTGTALTDDIYFYSDTTATNLIKTAQVVGTSHQDSLGVGTYYWRVQSTDAAGNIGPFSNVRRVNIQ